MATVKFWQGMDEASNIEGADKMMIGKNATGEAQYVNFDKANQFLSIQGMEMKPVPAGALPAGPSGETRTMEILEAGTWTYGGNSFVNPSGSIMKLWWNGTTWSLGSSVALPKGADGNKINLWSELEKPVEKNSFVWHNNNAWFANKQTDQEPSDESEDWVNILRLNKVHGTLGFDKFVDVFYTSIKKDKFLFHGLTNSDGSLSENVNFRSLLNQTVKKGDLVVVTTFGNSTGALLYALFNKNKVFLRGENNAGSSGLKTFYINVEEDGYINISYHYYTETEAQQPFVEVLIPAVDFKKDIEKLLKNSRNLSVKNLTGSDFFERKFIYNFYGEGYTNVNSTRCISDLIFVPKDTKLTIYLAVDNISQGVAHFFNRENIEGIDSYHVAKPQKANQLEVIEYTTWQDSWVIFQCEKEFLKDAFVHRDDVDLIYATSDDLSDVHKLNEKLLHNSTSNVKNLTSMDFKDKNGNLNAYGQFYENYNTKRRITDRFFVPKGSIIDFQIGTDTWGQRTVHLYDSETAESSYESHGGSVDNELYRGKVYVAKDSWLVCQTSTNQDLERTFVNISTSEDIFEKSRPYNYDLYVPNYVFGVNSGSGEPREYFTNIYAESMVRKKLSVKLNGGLKASLQTHVRNDVPIETIPTQIEITSSNDKAIEQFIKLDYIRANRKNAQNKPILMLMLGDSITDQDVDFFDKSGGGTISNFIGQFFEMDNKDVGNITFKSLGTKSPSDRTISYKGEDIRVKTKSEGRGAWAAFTYAMLPRLGNLMIDDLVSEHNILTSQALFSLLGLKTKTPFDSESPTINSREWENTFEKNNEILSTPFGRFKPDIDEHLWKVLKLRWGYKSNYTSYEGNQSAIYNEINEFLFGLNGNIQNPTGGVSLNPDNPFFDIKAAQAYSGAHIWKYPTAFSLQAWLDRYRTMDDLGVRLTGNANQTVVGSDGKSYKIGSKVSNVNDFDVATPTHVVYALGTNDSEGYTYTNQIGVNLLNIIKSHNNTIQIGFSYSRHSGVYSPGEWADYGFMNDRFPTGKFAKDNFFKEYLGDFNLSSRINYIPTFFTQSPLSTKDERYAYDLDDTINGAKKAIAGIDITHFSATAMRSIAYQLQAWIYWTLQ
jgi:hypothetical protein